MGQGTFVDMGRRLRPILVMSTLLISTVHPAIAENTLLADAKPETSVEISPPAEAANSIVALPFIFAMERAANGEVSISGYLPTDQLKNTISDRFGDLRKDQSTVASGAPEGFNEAALLGLDAIEQVAEGRLTFNGIEWALVARVKTEAEKARITTQLQSSPTKWRVSLDVALDAKPAAEPEPETPAPAAADEPNDDQPTISEVDPIEAINLTPLASTLVDLASPPEIAPPEKPQPQVAENADDLAAEAEKDTSATSTADNRAEDAQPRRYLFTAGKAEDAKLNLFGVVPQRAAKFYIGNVAGGANVEKLFVSAGAPDGFLAQTVAGIKLLKTLENGVLKHEFGAWSLSGEARSAAVYQAILNRVANSDSLKGMAADITVTPPIKICREHVEHLAEANAILFGSGSARLVAGSARPLDELAEYLQECPDAIVHVEGHTDADGSADKNLALSVARAEAVVAELIERGVRIERLYAVGYGESQPLATNDTVAGKKQNRRIVFKILDD